MVYALPEGPVHKRGEITGEGWFVGMQWPGVFVKRKSDRKVLNIARQKVRVHESMYTVPLATRVDEDAINNHHSRLAVELNKSGTETTESDDSKAEPADDVRPETDNNHVWAAKFLRNHKQNFSGQMEGPTLTIEESAMHGNADQIDEGIYIDTVVSSEVDQLASKIKENTGNGMSLKDSLIKAIRESKQVVQRGGLAIGKNTSMKRRKAIRTNLSKRVKALPEAMESDMFDAEVVDTTMNEPSVSGECRSSQNMPTKANKRPVPNKKKKESYSSCVKTTRIQGTGHTVQHRS
jgi:hypothetical protein